MESWQIRKAKDAFQQNDCERTLYYLKQAKEQGLEHEEMEFMAGTCLQIMKRHSEAISEFNRAIAKYPSDCNLYFMRSTSKSELGDKEGELEDLQKAIYYSRQNHPKNKIYNEQAKLQGRNSATELYEFHLATSQMLRGVPLYDGLRDRDRQSKENIGVGNVSYSLTEFGKQVIGFPFFLVWFILMGKPEKLSVYDNIAINYCYVLFVLLIGSLFVHKDIFIPYKSLKIKVSLRHFFAVFASAIFLGYLFTYYGVWLTFEMIISEDLPFSWEVLILRRFFTIVLVLIIVKMFLDEDLNPQMKNWYKQLEKG